MKVITSLHRNLLRLVPRVTRTIIRRAIAASAVSLVLPLSVATADTTFPKARTFQPLHFGPLSPFTKVLQPRAKVFGYSLDDMASAVANFSISGNDPAFYPDTPFQ